MAFSFYLFTYGIPVNLMIFLQQWHTENT